MLFPAPKAQPRKSTSAGRKRGKKMVLTDKPVKQAREKATRKRMLPKVKSAKHKKKHTVVSSSDSETDAETPPMTDEEEPDEIEPAD